MAEIQRKPRQIWSLDSFLIQGLSSFIPSTNKSSAAKHKLQGLNFTILMNTSSSDCGPLLLKTSHTRREIFPNLIGKIFLIISKTANSALLDVHTMQIISPQLLWITRELMNLMQLQVMALAKQDHFPIIHLCFFEKHFNMSIISYTDNEILCLIHLKIWMMSKPSYNVDIPLQEN